MFVFNIATKQVGEKKEGAEERHQDIIKRSFS